MSVSRLWPEERSDCVSISLWAQVMAWLAEEHDREAYAVDATHVRVHAHGSRARGGYAAQAVGRSRGGLTSQVHLLTDALVIRRWAVRSQRRMTGTQPLCSAHRQPQENARL